MKADNGHDILEALGLGEKEHLALVGAGGKTSLLFALAGRLLNKKVIISATTKIHYDEASSFKKPICTLQEPDWKKRLESCLKWENQAVLISEMMDTGKVKGISSSLADELFCEKGIDYLVLEADGAAGRPVKAPAAKEPVIPFSVTKVVAVMGLDVINQPFHRENVFRQKEFRKITGIKPGEKIVPERLLSLFIDPRGLFKNTPPFSQKIVFLNRMDLLADKRQAFVLADLIAREGVHTDRIVVGSIKHGEYHYWS